MYVSHLGIFDERPWHINELKGMTNKIKNIAFEAPMRAIYSRNY